MLYSHRFVQSFGLLQRIRLFAAGVLIALASSGLSATTVLDKDASYGEMLALASQMKSLESSMRTDATAATAYADALARYREISASLGGDDPGRVGGSHGTKPAVGSSSPRVAAAAPAACGSSTTTFTQATPTPLADNAVTTSTLVVSGAGPYLYDVNVQTFLRHTFSADLDVTIMSPAGTVVTLTTDNGSTFDDVFNGTVWDDNIDPGSQVPYTANDRLVIEHAYANGVLASPLVPEEPLGAFIGENPNGTWTITISDDTNLDTGTLDSWSLTLTTLPTMPSITTVPTATNSTPVAISATGTPVVTSTIVVSGAGTSLIDVNATTFITHTFSSDLDVTVTSPAGTVVTLTTDNGSTFDNVFNGTVWDDNADPGTQVPYTANDRLVVEHAYANLTTATPLVPEEPLAAFVGEDPNGTWTLTVSDDSNLDGGSIDSWSLDIKTFACSSADLAITKTDGVATAAPGGSVTYTITGTNPGPDPVADATITDTFPGALTCTWTCAGASGGTCTASGSGNISSAANLPVGGSVTYTASCTIASSATGSLINAASIASASIPDPDTSNNQATDTDALTPQADLAITKTDGVASVTAGGSTIYTITASNAGPSDATGATVADTFPAVETCSWTCTGAGGGTCAASGSGNISDSVNLPSGSSVTYATSCNVSLAASGTINNTATITAPGGVTDTNAANNSAVDSDTVGAAPAAHVTGTKTVSPAGATFARGSNVIYTIVLTNSGSGAQGDNPGDEFVDTLPPGVAFASVTATSGTATFSAGAVHWNGTLAAGASVTITIVATIGATASGTIANQGTISYDSNGDGTNDASAFTDDPAIGGAADPTTFAVAAAPATAVAPAPTLTALGLLLLTLGLVAAGLRRRRANR